VRFVNVAEPVSGFDEVVAGIQITVVFERGSEPAGRCVYAQQMATEEGFQLLKDLESRNLVVPVVGDFGGPKAIRAIGTYLKARGATVAAFYLSNVEQYLYQDAKWDAFCRSVATLPLDTNSTFIRSSSGGIGYGRGGGFVSSLGAMAAETRGCTAGGDRLVR